MQLVPNGPTIPTKLLAAHQEGRVAFFCGAGISCGAGLPLFGKLVNDLCKKLKFPEPAEYTSLDQVLSDIENKVVGGRKKVLEETWKMLQPDYSLPEATTYHVALLDLAETKYEKRTQLVTTNFDRIFEHCKANRNQPHPESLVAPRPPIPKQHYWNGIVYLHGRLPDNQYVPGTEDNLILTSGDLGRAYLSERWAARFVTEMFRNYVVCFVGYSLDDPVMRYLTDAMSNDERDGYALPERYIFLSADNSSSIEKWKNNNMTVIPYGEHDRLRATIVKWADNYTRGFDAKKEIVREVASKPPSDIPPDAKYRDVEPTDRLMWALTDQKAAEFFAFMEPLPDWKWINILFKPEFDHEDYESFNHSISIKPSLDMSKLGKFSLLEPKVKFEDMHVWSIGANTDSQFQVVDKSVNFFYYWISRHLNTPEMAIWLGGLGARINETLKRHIKDGLSSSPPQSHAMKQAWEMFLTDQVSISKRHAYEPDLFHWNRMLGSYGLTDSLKRDIEHHLRPAVDFNAFFSYGAAQENKSINECAKIGDFFSIDVDVYIGHGMEGIKEIALSDDTSSDDKLYYIKLFINSLHNLMEFGDSLYTENEYFSRRRSQWTAEEIIEGSEDIFINEWQHLPSAIYGLLPQIQEINEEKAHEILAFLLECGYNFIQRVGLRLLCEERFFDPELAFVVLTRREGKMLTDPNNIPQVDKLLAEKAGAFSEDQLRTIQMLILNNTRSNGGQNE